MDPDAALNEIRQLATDIITASDVTTDEILVLNPEDTVRLADLILSLDRWIITGGFRPKDWR